MLNIPEFDNKDVTWSSIPAGWQIEYISIGEYLFKMEDGKLRQVNFDELPLDPDNDLDPEIDLDDDPQPSQPGDL
jgi:hypothetical protein